MSRSTYQSSKRTIKPQPGPQEGALASTAKIVLLGGAKGGGKSWAMRLGPLRHIHRPGYHAVIFRRSLPQLKKPGGQWDKSFELYPHLGATPHKSELRWTFPAKATIMFSHLQDENDWLDWQGTETAFYGFDQLEEFSQTQFLKILGCMRTTSGAPTQILATMNPDAESWVRDLVDPWIAEDGYIDPDRNGKTYYFTVIEDEITWVDQSWRDANGRPPISIAYFSADIWDNPALLAEDPDYLSNLMAQNQIDRERFLGQKGRGGNWNIKIAAGKVFRSDWYEFLDRLPQAQIKKTVRFWDFAGTIKQSKGDDPDWTVGGKLIEFVDLPYMVLADVVRLRVTPAELDRVVRNTASQDGAECLVRYWIDPGQAGIYQDQKLRLLLRGFNACGTAARLDLYTYAKPLSRASEFGEIKLLRASWNQALLNEFSGFPDADHDDQVAACSGAYLELTGEGAQRFKATSYR